jgi:hypothetical protein
MRMETLTITAPLPLMLRRLNVLRNLQAKEEKHHQRVWQIKEKN